MEHKKSRLDLLRDHIEDLSIASRRYQSLLYFIWFLFVALAYGTMIGLNLFLSEDAKIMSTKIDSELEFGNATYILVDKNVNKKERRATFFIGKEELESTFEDRSWHVTVEYQNGSGDGDIQSKIYQGENGFTYIQLTGLAADWQGLRVELTTRVDDQTEEQQDYIVVGNDESQTDKVSFESEKEVELLSIDYAVEQRSEAISANEELIAENEKQIEDNKDKVDELEADKLYQTESQKTETQNSINQLNEQNRQLESTNYSTEKQNEELKEQIQKLEEKADSRKKT